MRWLAGRSKPQSPRWRASLMLVAFGLLAADQPASFARCLSGKPTARWEIPGLREASGLALTEDGRLLVHGDESARIIAIDPAQGQLVGQFQLGAAPPRQDFEGIAVVDSTGYLVTSTGVLYEFMIPSAGKATATLSYTVIPTPAGRSCEIEGLGYESSSKVLLLACKHMKKSSEPTAIFRWSLSERRLASPAKIELDETGLPGKVSGRKLNITGVDVDPSSGEWVLLSSLDQTIAVADPNGRVRATERLARGHRQPEGLALSTNRRIFIADEGGKGLSVITVYACR